MTNAAAAHPSAWASQPSWFRCMLFVGLGGMLYLALALFVGASLAEWDFEDRLVEGDSSFAMQWLGWGFGGVAAVLFFLMRISGVRGHRALWLVAAWICGSALIAGIAWEYGPVSIYVFLLTWVGFAIPAGAFVAVMTPPLPPRSQQMPRRPQPPPPPRAARQPQPPAPPRAAPMMRVPGPNMTPNMVIGGPGFGAMLNSQAGQTGRTRVSALGRIPPEVADLLTSNVNTVRSVVLSEIRADTAGARRGFTSAAVMDRVLQDWWENGNIDPLTPDDVTDLESFIALSSSLTATIPNPDGEAVYRCLLNALLDDWLVSWNADGNIGPPVR
jgi:hypothetical protein